MHSTTRKHTISLSHTHSLTLSLYTHTHTHTLSHTLTHTLTHTHTHTVSLSLSHADLPSASEATDIGSVDIRDFDVAQRTDHASRLPYCPHLHRP
jgi:hypothetical protein